MGTTPFVSETDESAFRRIFGERRGRGGDGHDLLGLTGARTAQELLLWAQNGKLGAALAALSDVGAVADEEEQTDSWPPKEVEKRDEERASERQFEKWGGDKVPSDEEAEALFDPADYLRRGVSEAVADVALAAWTPTFREVAHAVGLRRFDISDHIICIDGELHLFRPANVLLAGDSGFTQEMACGQSASVPARSGRVEFVPRGAWMQAYQDKFRNKKPRLAICSGCAVAGAEERYMEACTEGADNWLPLPEHEWKWLQPNTASSIYQALRFNPGMSTEGLEGLGISVCRKNFLFSVQGPIQQDDKPCRWYRAPALTLDERREVNILTFDARISGGKILEAQCPQTPYGFMADDAWRRRWCEMLLEHLRRRGDPHPRRTHS